MINNHFKSGPDTCIAHRTEQAEYNAALVAFIQADKPNACIVLGGDLNIYPRPTISPMVRAINSGRSMTRPGTEEPVGGPAEQAPESAYSYVYLGMAQTIDHMFVNQPLLTDLHSSVSRTSTVTFRPTMRAMGHGVPAFTTRMWRSSSFPRGRYKSLSVLRGLWMREQNGDGLTH